MNRGKDKQGYLMNIIRLYSANEKSRKTQFKFWIFESSETFVHCIKKYHRIQNSIVNTILKFSVTIKNLKKKIYCKIFKYIDTAYMENYNQLISTRNSPE